MTTGRLVTVTTGATAAGADVEVTGGAGDELGRSVSGVVETAGSDVGSTASSAGLAAGPRPGSAVVGSSRPNERDGRSKNAILLVPVADELERGFEDVRADEEPAAGADVAERADITIQDA